MIRNKSKCTKRGGFGHENRGMIASNGEALNREKHKEEKYTGSNSQPPEKITVPVLVGVLTRPQGRSSVLKVIFAIYR